MNKPAFGVRISVLTDGQRIPLLFDRCTSLPMDLPTRFTLAQRWQNGDSSSTAENELRAIAYFMNWAERRGIDLDQRFCSGNFLTNLEIENLCDALRESQRNQSQPAVNNVWVGLSQQSKKLAKVEKRPAVIGNNVWYQRIKYVEGYVTWLMDDVLSRLDIRDLRAIPMRRRREDVVKKFRKQLPNTANNGREGLKDAERSRLLEIIDPESVENPYQAANRFRNYVMLRLYFNIGCRLSEALVLYTTDFVPDTNKPMLKIRRRPNNPLDPRNDLPLVKTNERDIPLSPELADLIYRYVLGDRKKTPGSKTTPFLFLTRKGKPIAVRTVGDLTLSIRKRAPEFSGRLTTHVLRHDWNDRFTALAKRQGIRDEEAARLVNYLMGWSKTSEQRRHYTKNSTRQEAHDISLKLQQENWGKKRDE